MRIINAAGRPGLVIANRLIDVAATSGGRFASDAAHVWYALPPSPTNPAPWRRAPTFEETA